jgi:hypothetical protein
MLFGWLFKGTEYSPGYLSMSSSQLLVSEYYITIATTGPEDMNLTNPGKKGNELKSA